MPGPVVYGKRQLAERQRAGRAPPLQVKGKKHRMNLDHIRYFQAIAYYEHYGRAAQALLVAAVFGLRDQLQWRRAMWAEPVFVALGRHAGKTPVDR